MARISRTTEAELIEAVKEVESGVPVKRVARNRGIAITTLRRRVSKARPPDSPTPAPSTNGTPREPTNGVAHGPVEPVVNGQKVTLQNFTQMMDWARLKKTVAEEQKITLFNATRRGDLLPRNMLTDIASRIYAVFRDAFLEEDVWARIVTEEWDFDKVKAYSLRVGDRAVEEVNRICRDLDERGSRDTPRATPPEEGQ